MLQDGSSVQLCSRSSHRSLQICGAKDNPSRLVFVANGPIGGDALQNTHFLIEKDADGYLSFKNGYLNFYLNFCDNFSASGLSRQSKYAKIRDDTKFRLHEVLGSNEYFSLESMKYKGRFLACHPDGTVTTSRSNSEEVTHFFLNPIRDMSTSTNGFISDYSPLKS